MYHAAKHYSIKFKSYRSRNKPRPRSVHGAEGGRSSSTGGGRPLVSPSVSMRLQPGGSTPAKPQHRRSRSSTHLVLPNPLSRERSETSRSDGSGNGITRRGSASNLGHGSSKGSISGGSAGSHDSVSSVASAGHPENRLMRGSPGQGPPRGQSGADGESRERSGSNGRSPSAGRRGGRGERDSPGAHRGVSSHMRTAGDKGSPTSGLRVPTQTVSHSHLGLSTSLGAQAHRGSPKGGDDTPPTSRGTKPASSPRMFGRSSSRRKQSGTK
jgi:hypothetical protein